MMSKAEHAVHNQWFEWITKRQQPQLDLISKQGFHEILNRQAGNYFMEKVG